MIALVALTTAVVLLLLVAAVRLPERDGKRPGRLLLLSAVGWLAMAAIYWWFANPLGWVPDSDASRLLKSTQQRRERARSDPDTDLLVLVNGGSLSMRGLDGRRLQVGLTRALKLRVSVVQLSLAGANHLEREAILRRIRATLNRDQVERLRQLPVIVLWEVHDGYDMDPLSQFDENLGTARAYGYMDWRTALVWGRVVVSSGSRLRESAIHDTPEVLRHVAISSLGIGALRWRVPQSSLAPMRGYVPKSDGSERDRVVGLQLNVERSQRFKPPSVPAYVDEILIPRYMSYIDGRRRNVIFFSPPSRHLMRMAYVQSFCRSHYRQVCIHYTNRELLRRLSHKRYWLDGSHLTGVGARLYTRWVTQVLADAIKSKDMAARNGG
jgi:hypothetical protein